MKFKERIGLILYALGFTPRAVYHEGDIQSSGYWYRRSKFGLGKFVFPIEPKDILYYRA